MGTTTWCSARPADLLSLACYPAVRPSLRRSWGPRLRCLLFRCPDNHRSLPTAHPGPSFPPVWGQTRFNCFMITNLICAERSPCAVQNLLFVLSVVQEVCYTGQRDRNSLISQVVYFLHLCREAVNRRSLHPVWHVQGDRCCVCLSEVPNRFACCAILTLSVARNQSGNLAFLDLINIQRGWSRASVNIVDIGSSSGAFLPENSLYMTSLSCLYTSWEFAWHSCSTKYVRAEVKYIMFFTQLSFIKRRN